MWLTRTSIHNPYFATMLMLALVVLGLFSLQRLPVEEFPDIRFPVAVVSTNYSGASPTVVESEVTRPIEEAVNTINGVKNIRSYSFEGASVVVVEFELTVNPVTAVQDTREKVGALVGGFRREIGTPTVSQVNPNDEASMTLLVSSAQADARTLSTWSDQVLRKKLQTVEGIGEVKLIGASKRQINVQLLPDQLDALQVDIQTVVETLRAANRDYPAGRIEADARELAVRVDGKLKTLQEFAALPLTTRNGATIRLEDIAHLVDGEAERDSVALINGQRALSVEIKVARGANLIQTSAGVHAQIAELKAQMPAGFAIKVLRDKAKDVEKSLNNVRTTLIEGAALTVAIVFLFLGSWRSTVITGLTLPVALIGTMFAIAVAGFTLNVMTLLALTLSIGLLIDDAIVVRENIVRHAGFGKDHYRAAVDGTEEIGLAVLATTLTVIAVFLPVGFMGGVIGKFFQQFGLTVVVAVTISLLVSFSLDPMLSSVWHDPHHHGDAHRGPFGRALDWFEGLMDRFALQYSVAIAWVLDHRKTTLASAVALLIASFALTPWIGAEFMPKTDTGKFVVKFKTAPGASFEYTEMKSREVEAQLRTLPEVVDVYTNIGGEFGGGRNGVSMRVFVTDKAQRQRSVQAMFPEVRQRLAPLAGIEVQSVLGEGGPGAGGKPVRIGVRGSDFQQLGRIVSDLKSKLGGISGLSDLESSLDESEPAYAIELRRDAASPLGVDLTRLGSTLSVLLAGNTATTWEAPDGENYDVRLQIPKADRDHEWLDRLKIASGNGSETVMVPLSNLVSITPSQVPRQIDRMDQQREVTLTANISAPDSARVFSEVAKVLKDYPLPAGYQFDQGGESRDMKESFSYAVQALAMGVIFIYMILAAQFRSFLQPITIMMSLPLAFIGVFMALLLWKSTINMFSIIGIIMLMGLAAKNGILLVDFANQARREGMARREALCEAGRVRLRPILMTSFAMIFGMLPLALSGHSGSELNAPMAHAVIGGMVTSTILTLFVVPVVYSYFDQISGFFRAKFAPPPRQS